MARHKPRQKKQKTTPIRQDTASRLPVQKGETARNRFQPERLLGTGGMCEVHAALDLRRLEWSDKSPRVAVKRLLPKFSANRQAQLALAQEFFTLRHLVHPGVIRAYDLHPEPEGVCYSMELLEGDSLYQALSSKPAGYGKEGVKMGEKLFQTLEYLHGKGVVHADVKPANLFEAAGGRLVLIDFNISRVTAKPGAASAAVSQGLWEKLKIPAYSQLHASPERLATGSPSIADDIFSACCTVYELIAGHHPFNRLPSCEAEEKKMQPKRPEGMTGSQWKALLQGLSFSPEKRPGAGYLRQKFAVSSRISRLASKLAGQEGE